jgi:Mn-dependent DtxR family transcriptional regulator
MSIAPSKPPFTEKQGQYLAFIHTYVLLNGRPPAEADMERHFRVTPPSVHRMVVELERRGLIRRRPGQPRSIALTVPPEQLPQLRPQSIETSVSRY